MSEKNNNSTDIPSDLSEISRGYSNIAFNEGERLKFAKQILFCLFVLVVVVFIGSWVILGWYSTHLDCKSGEPIKNEELINLVSSILDITKTVVPATVTLVLGFYFGRKDT